MASYGSDAGLTAYLTSTGRVLPLGSDPAVVRVFGTMYVDSWDCEFKGVAVTPENSFPRDLWPVVPINVEDATYEAAFAYASGVAIFGAGGTSAGQVTREKVDVLEVAYATPQDGTGWWENNRYVLPLAYTLLLPFMRRKGCWGGGAFVVSREVCAE